MITQEELQQLCHYDPGTGVFTWTKDCPRGNYKKGEALGSRHVEGYLRASFKGHRLMLHRAAWMYVHGRFPNEDLDHINGDKADNRISNLRECNNALNVQNQRRARRDNLSGVLGVHHRPGTKNPWHAHIGVNGKQIHIGCFPTPEKAHRAYIAKKREVHSFGEL